MPTYKFNPPSIEEYTSKIPDSNLGKYLNCLLYSLGLGGIQFAVDTSSEIYNLDETLEISEAFQKKAEELLGYKLSLHRVDNMENIPSGHYAFALFGFKEVKKRASYASFLGWDYEDEYASELYKTAYDFHVMRLDPGDSINEAHWTHKAGWKALPSEVSQQDWNDFRKEFDMEAIFLVLEQ